MNMHGSLSIERKPVRWSKAHSDGYLSVIAVGILSGTLVACARMPIHLPGHKVLWWMAPVLATRLMTRRGAGASVGALSTAMTTLVLGGRLAGGVASWPLVILAGVILDLGANFCEQRDLPLWRQVLVLAVVGMVGSLICFVKRLFDPVGAFFSVGNIEDLLTAAGSYAFFGFLAGMLGAVAGFTLPTLRREPEYPACPPER
jgi:hypothetical protein